MPMGRPSEPSALSEGPLLFFSAGRDEAFAGLRDVGPDLQAVRVVADVRWRTYSRHVGTGSTRHGLGGRLPRPPGSGPPEPEPNGLGP
jgi:hypothetical protein